MGVRSRHERSKYHQTLTSGRRILNDIGPTLHSLQYRGFVQDRIAKRYGYIFDLTQDVSTTPGRLLSLGSIANTPHQAPELRSLRNLPDQISIPSQSSIIAEGTIWI